MAALTCGASERASTRTTLADGLAQAHQRDIARTERALPVVKDRQALGHSRTFAALRLSWNNARRWT